ncbi:LacI family DNA-binding transcriptional regulator [Paenibacillus chitinolyticus]|uniref:LacI family DNA-binding transcriptional regulator n=1 Tax=Paenibacillus chitinolyticus TaxID=79263 RepID=UPI003CFE5862
MNKITIKDIAAEAGVSIATVSNVMNGTGRVSGETAKRVLQVIDRHDYAPSTAARFLKERRSQLIGILVPTGDRGRLEDNPFYWQLVMAVEAEAREERLHVIVSGVTEEDPLTFVQERQLDGIIAIGITGDSPLLGRIAQLDVPCVYLDCYLAGGENLQVVNMNDRMGGYLGTKHLLSLGHERIAVIAGDIVTSGVYEERWLGYTRALEESGIEADRALLVETPVSLLGGYHSAQQVYMLSPKVTAVFAFSDVAAIGLMKGLQELGVRIPDDLSVMGYDDIDYAGFMTPSLTTIRQDIGTKGKTAIRRILSMIRGSVPAEHSVTLPVELKRRQSTARRFQSNSIQKEE